MTEYEVERIVAIKTDPSGQKLALVHWKGYSEAESTWEPYSFLNKGSRDEAARLEALQAGDVVMVHFTPNKARHHKVLGVDLKHDRLYVDASSRKRAIGVVKLSKYLEMAPECPLRSFLLASVAK